LTAINQAHRSVAALNWSSFYGKRGRWEHEPMLQVWGTQQGPKAQPVWESGWRLFCTMKTNS